MVMELPRMELRDLLINVNKTNERYSINEIKDICRELLDNIKDDTKSFTYSEIRLLELATGFGSIELMDLFIKEYGYLPENEPFKGMCLLHWAVCGNNYDMVEYILQYIDDINVIYSGMYQDIFAKSKYVDCHILNTAKSLYSVNPDIIELLQMHGAKND